MARRTCCRKWKRTLYQAATVCVIVFLLLQTPVDITFRSPTGAPLSDLESFDADGRLPADGRHFGNSTSGGAVSSRVTIDTTVPSAVAPTQQVASSPPATTTKVLEAPAGKTGPSVAEASGAKNCTIFTFWNFPRPPLYAHLNVETWRKHAHGLCDGPVLLNKTNVLKWIPDMPEEFFRLPYDAASSDMVRYGVLYHNGGLYFDSDFIVVKDLSDLIVRLPSYDLVSYETASAAQRCTAGGTFSSNFMGGRRGSEVLGEVYRTQVAALQKHCKTEKQYKSEMICCMDDKHVPCHIPWAQLGEGIGHPVVGRFVKKTRELLRQGKNPSEIKAPSIFCFKNEESFVPRDFVTILNDKPKVKQAMSIWEKAREKNAMERMAYHLFNANSGVQNMNRQQLFDTSTVLGTLYSRSFAESPSSGPSSPQLLKADALLEGGLGGAKSAKMRPYSKFENGGCYHFKDRATCCKFKDGRQGEPFEGQDCVPSKPGKTMNGNVCEPEGWEDPDAAESFWSSGHAADVSLSQGSS